MKTYFAIFCLLCLACPIWALAQNIPQNPNKTDRKGRRQGAWTITYTQDWKETKIKDSIAYYRLLAYKDNKPQGLTTDYYRSGKKQSEAKLIADRPEEIIDGKATWYREDGQVYAESTFIQGVRVGKEVTYYPSGKVATLAYYHAGKKAGKETNYDEAGKTTFVRYMDEGEEIPLQTTWDNAVASYEKGNFASADTLFADIYVMFQNRFGKDHPNCVQALSYLWNTQKNLQKNTEASTHLEEMIRLRELQKIDKDTALVGWLLDAILYYKAQKNYSPIEKHLATLIATQADLTGKDSPQTIQYRHALGQYYESQKRYSEAEKVHENNLAYLKATFPQQPEKYQPDIASLAGVYENLQKYDKAEALYLEAIKTLEAKNDTTEQHVNILKSLTDLLQAQDKSTEALPFSQKAIALQMKRKGTQNELYIKLLRNVLQSHRDLQQFEMAEKIAQEMQQISEKLYGQASAEYANVRFDFGILYHEAGKLQEAKNAYQEAIQAINNITQDERNTEDAYQKLAEIWAYLGETHSELKEVAQAEKAFLQAQTYLKNVKEENFTTSNIYEKIGTAQIRINNYAEAEDAYLKCVEINKNAFGDQHHNYIQAIANLTTLYNYHQKADKSLEILDTHLLKLRHAGRQGESIYASLLHSKAIAHKQLEQDSLAILAYQEIVTHHKALYGEDSPNHMNQFASLIQAQITAKRLTEAEANLQQLQKIMERKGIRTIDKFHYQTYLVLRLFLANTQGDYKKAIEYAQEQNAIGRFLGNPKIGLGELAMNYFINNQSKEATLAYRQYLDLCMQDVKQTFPYLSNNQRVNFYTSQVQYFADLYYYAALAEPFKINFGEKDSLTLKQNKVYRNSLTYIKHPNNTEIFNYQLQTKGILFEASQKMKNAILGSNEAGLIAKFNVYQTKKEEMNKLFQTPDSRQKEEKKAKLNEELKEMEKSLAQQSSLFTKTSATDYKWQDAQKKLKKGEALVEMLAISAGQKVNPKKYKYSDMYLAFIITPDTRDFPLCVYVGEGDSLETRYANNYQNCIKARKKDKHSYLKYWKKIADTLKGVRKIYFAPDGIYHKININSLQNPTTEKYVLEEKEVQFISQARDFVQYKNLPAYAPTEVHILGAPDYNTLPTEAGKEFTPNKLQPIREDTTQRFFAGGEITELHGTATEAENIAQIFTENGQKSTKYLRQEATEVFLKNLRNPPVLHIATHGFFVAEKNTSAFGSFNEEELKNPLRRCGILLAHCKEAFKPKDRVVLPEDGIMTAEEAQNLMLDKTELVVLSACETGLGEVRNGEGVYGLQRAFQTAGAKSVLMSLWTVSDQATQELMTEFYRQWFKLKNKRLAFREAQLMLKNKYPEPYFWGAFLLIGE